MRSFSIFFGAPRRVFVFAVLVGVLAAAPGQAARDRGIEELTNFLLSPDYSQWLVGAVSLLASEEEIDGYLALTDDEAAVEFIEAFWERRHDPDRAWPQPQDEGIFAKRAAEADKLYTEGTALGRRTDRGTIFVLYGPPARIDFFPVSPPRQGNIEIWRYPKNAAPGLTGESPRLDYFFLKEGDLTVAYTPRIKDRRRMRSGV